MKVSTTSRLVCIMLVPPLKFQRADIRLNCFSPQVLLFKPVTCLLEYLLSLRYCTWQYGRYNTNIQGLRDTILRGVLLAYYLLFWIFPPIFLTSKFGVPLAQSSGLVSI